MKTQKLLALSLLIGASSFAQTLKESLNKYAVNCNILLNKNIPQQFLTN